MQRTNEGRGGDECGCGGGGGDEFQHGVWVIVLAGSVSAWNLWTESGQVPLHTDIRFEYLATEGTGMGIHLGALTTAPNCWIYRSRRRQSHLGVAF